MVYTSLAIVALSASAALPNLFHLHNTTRAALPQPQRVELRLMNNATTFREVEVDGQIYSINGSDGLRIVAPAGTPIYAGGNVPFHHRGDVLLTVSPALNHRTVTLR